MIHTAESLKSGFEKLESLKIPLELIKKSNLDEEVCQRLYDKLTYYTDLSNPIISLNITHEIQLYILAGIVPLDLNEHILFKDMSGATLLHYAVLSKETAIFNHIYHEKSELLFKKDNFGRTVAHYAAYCGNLDVLNLIHTVRPNLLMLTDNLREKIINYAIYSENTQSLDWMKEHTKELFKYKNRNNQLPINFASQYGKTISLEKIIKLTANDSLTVSSQYPMLIQQLPVVLKDNYRLTKVILPSDTPEDIKKIVEGYTQRNQEVLSNLFLFKIVLQGARQKGNVFFTQPKELLYEFFSLIVPDYFSSTLMYDVFKKLVQKINPRTVKLSNKLLKNSVFDKRYAIKNSKYDEEPRSPKKHKL